MDNSRKGSTDTLRLILVPSLVSLAVTLLRLAGELRHWSPAWFSPETGGITPSGLSWVIGITWLVVPFGAYFALRLLAAGRGPAVALWKALLLVAVGLALVLGGRWLIPALGFPRYLIFIWLYMAIAAAIQFLGWPPLARTLFYYGLAARIPVVVIMFFAMVYNWGTHYDYVGMPPQFSMELLPRFLWLAFFPQLIFWLSFTILMGTASGVCAAAIGGRFVRSRPGSQS